MKKAYEQEIEMWNRVFEECIPVDLRNLDLKVEPMFDEALNIKMQVIIFMKKIIMRLRQATTNYWKEKFARFGKEIIYLEFEYPWQEGMNRLFVYQS